MSSKLLEGVDHLKRDNSEKFQELVISHLCTFLDLGNGMLAEILEDTKISTKTEFVTPFLRRKKPKTISPLFGQTLTNQNVGQIASLMKYIEEEGGLNVEGLFRKPGTIERQRILREDLDTLEIVDFSIGNYTMKDCAGVLKEFLKELPEPLLPKKHFNAYSQIVDLSDDLKQVSSLQLLIQLLPADNCDLLRHLMCLLKAVSNEPKMKMNATNLAIVFAPLLAMPKNFTINEQRMTAGCLTCVIELMIKNADVLFQYNTELVADVTQYLQMLDRASSSVVKLPKTSNGSALVCDSTLRTLSRFSRFSKRIKKENNGEEDDKDDDEIVISSSVAFADRKASTEAATTINTSTALADLHSYILAMPESAHKRKLISRMMTPTTSNEVETSESSKHAISKSIRKIFGRKGRDSKTADSASINLASCLSPSVRHCCSTSCVTPCVHDTAPVEQLFSSGGDGSKSKAAVNRCVTFAEKKSLLSGADADKPSSDDDISCDESNSDTSLDINDFDDSDKENKQ